MGCVAPERSLGGEQRKQAAPKMCKGLKGQGHDYTRIEGTRDTSLMCSCLSGINFLRAQVNSKFMAYTGCTIYLLPLLLKLL